MLGISGKWLVGAGALGGAVLGGMACHALWQGAFSRGCHTSASRGEVGGCTTMLDRYMPVFDVTEIWQTDAAATPTEAYAALRNLDLMRSPIVAGLVRLYMAKLSAFQALRGGNPPPEVPRTAGIDELVKTGWTVLEETPGKGIALGMAVNVAAQDGAPPAMDAHAFRGLSRPGFWKIVWGFSVERHGDGARLTTSTRTLATDPRSRARFWAHWTLIGPFAGLLKRRALALVKADAERRHAAAGGGKEALPPRTAAAV